MVTGYLLSLSQIIIAFPFLWLFEEVAISLSPRQASSLPGTPSPHHQPMLLVGQRTGGSVFPEGESSSQTPRGNPLERFPCCLSTLAAHPVPPSTSPPLPRTPRARHHSPGCIVPEGSAVSGNRRGQEQSWNCCVILSFAT